MVETEISGFPVDIIDEEEKELAEELVRKLIKKADIVELTEFVERINQEANDRFRDARVTLEILIDGDYNGYYSFDYVAEVYPGIVEIYEYSWSDDEIQEYTKKRRLIAIIYP